MIAPIAAQRLNPHQPVGGGKVGELTIADADDRPEGFSPVLHVKPDGFRVIDHYNVTLAGEGDGLALAAIAGNQFLARLRP